MAATTQAVPFEQLLGSELTLAMSFAGGRQGRFFSGIVSRFSSGDRSGKTSLYRASSFPRSGC